MKNVILLSLALTPFLLASSCDLDPKSDPRDKFIGKWLAYCNYDSLDVLDLKVNPVYYKERIVYKFDGMYEYFYYEGAMQRDAGFFDYEEATGTMYMNSTLTVHDTLYVSSVNKNILVFDDRRESGKYIEYHKM